MLSGGIKEGQLVLRTKVMHCVKKTTIIVGFTIIRPSENTRKKPQQNQQHPPSRITKDQGICNCNFTSLSYQIVHKFMFKSLSNLKLYKINGLFLLIESSRGKKEANIVGT